MAAKKENEHKGHRQRVKQKFMKFGLDVFEPHEVLELYLFYAIPRRDTNPVAHRLLNRYSTLSGVCDAPFEELTEDMGLSERTANWLKLLPRISELYVESKRSNDGVVEYSEFKDEFMSKLADEPDGCTALMLADAKCKIIYFGVISKSASSSAKALLCKVVDLSLRHQAKGVLIGQKFSEIPTNSLSGKANAAQKIKETLGNMGVYLLDFFIVSGAECRSLFN